MEYDINTLMEKWAPVLDHEDLPKIRDSHRRSTVAILLENQLKANIETIGRDRTQSLTYLLEAAPTNSMGNSSSNASDGAIDTYDPVLISLIRRSMPNLIAYDLCGVQPMTLPTGLIFALRSRYGNQTGTEALFNEPNGTWASSAAGNTASQTAVGVQTGTDPTLLITTGNTAYTFATGMTRNAAEALGDGTKNAFQEMSFSIEKISVTATSKALKAEYSHELAQDLKAVHGLDAETELSNILSSEILAEINRQVIRSIYATATIGAQDNVATAGYYDLDVDSNGRWMVEKFKGLLFQIEREANQIAKATRRGKGNFVLCSSDVASAFRMAGYLDYQSAMQKETLEVDDTGNTFAGTLFGQYKVYIDPYANSSAGNQIAVVGYKGTSSFDAGMFYCPYVPLQMYRAVGQDTFQPKIGFKTRYGMVAHPFATSAADGAIHVNKKNSYYRGFVVKNLV
jgi:hypothetical protein